MVLLYAALSSVWTAHDPGWYARLAKPWFQPPDVVFGVVWPLNFPALLGVGVWFTRSAASTGVWPAPLVLATLVVAALGWAWLFCVPNRTGAATVALAVAAVLTWVLVALVARSLPWAGVILRPVPAIERARMARAMRAHGELLVDGQPVKDQLEGPSPASQGSARSPSCPAWTVIGTLRDDVGQRLLVAHARRRGALLEGRIGDEGLELR